MAEEQVTKHIFHIPSNTMLEDQPEKMVNFLLKWNKRDYRLPSTEDQELNDLRKYKEQKEAEEKAKQEAESSKEEPAKEEPAQVEAKELSAAEKRKATLAAKKSKKEG